MPVAMPLVSVTERISGGAEQMNFIHLRSRRASSRLGRPKEQSVALLSTLRQRPPRCGGRYELTMPWRCIAMMHPSVRQRLRGFTSWTKALDKRICVRW